MSALLSPESTPQRRPSPKLRGLPTTAKQLNGLSFILLLAAVLGAGMFGLLLLNTQIQQQGFEVNELDAEVAASHEQEAALRTQLNAVSSSSELLRRASELGMVPYALPGYLDLRTGAVTGSPKPGSQADVPHIKTDRILLEEARARAEAEAKAKAEAEARARAEAEKAAAEEKAKQEQEQAEADQAASQPSAAPTSDAPNPPTPAPSGNG